MSSEYDRTAPAELTRLYVEITPALYAWARCRIPVGLRGNLDAADIIQETWLRVLRRVEEFDAHRGSFRQWTFGYARNVLHELTREERKKAALVDSISSAQIASEITTASRRAARNEGVAALVRCLHGLEETDRRLVIARGLEGRYHDEVALELGVTAAALRKRWQRLREQLIAQGIPPELTDVD